MFSIINLLNYSIDLHQKEMEHVRSTKVSDENADEGTKDGEHPELKEDEECHSKKEARRRQSQRISQD
jgi:hypothetical protein